MLLLIEFLWPMKAAKHLIYTNPDLRCFISSGMCGWLPRAAMPDKINKPNPSTYTLTFAVYIIFYARNAQQHSICFPAFRWLRRGYHVWPLHRKSDIPTNNVKSRVVEGGEFTSQCMLGIKVNDTALFHKQTDELKRKAENSVTNPSKSITPHSECISSPQSMHAF